MYCQSCGKKHGPHESDKCYDCKRIIGPCCLRLESIRSPILCPTCRVVRNANPKKVELDTICDEIAERAGTVDADHSVFVAAAKLIQQCRGDTIRLCWEVRKAVQKIEENDCLLLALLSAEASCDPERVR